MTEPWFGHWLQRWQEGRTGWHEPAGNSLLQEHWDVTGCRVLVPLCGKSPDLIWLAAQGNDVVGVELSPIAVAAFFSENKLAFTTTGHDGYTVFAAEEQRISIICGDYFGIAGERFDACFDRAALIALPEAMRLRYAAHTDSMLSDAARHYLVTLEYDQSLVKGPPFAVHPDEVGEYWPELTPVASREDIENAPPKFRAAGVTSMREVLWSNE